MNWIRKQFIVLIAISVVYIAFFLAHLPSSPAVLGAQTNLVLFEEPVAGKTPIISAMQSAQQSIDVTVYLLSDKDIIASLLAACGHGVRVRVMLEQHPFGGGNVNQKTMQALQGSCVQAKWTNASFALTHEKTIVVDNKEAFILNQNLTTSAFAKNREYDILDANPEDVLEVEKIFTADWMRSHYYPIAGHILVSPNTSRSALRALIASAQQTLFIETEVIDDPSIMQLLEEKAVTVTVYVILPSVSQIRANKRAIDLFVQHGILVKTLSSPYIHAKLIVVDGKQAYVGSVNLTTQSMDANREVGILIAQQDVVSKLQSYFLSDWEIAR